MPTALSNNIIASATRDILHTLKHPTNGAPLALMNNTEAKTLQQITETLYNKTNTSATNTTPTRDIPMDLRVPPKPEVPNNHTPGTSDMETTYQQSTKHKKQINKHKQQWGKLAATNNAVLETAHYAAYLICQDTPKTQNHTKTTSVTAPSTQKPDFWQNTKNSRLVLRVPPG